MVEQDTIRLLRECDAGVQMGVSAIDDVLDDVETEAFRQRLTDCKTQHEQLQTEIRSLLDQYQDEGKKPNPMARGMSWMKTGAEMTLHRSDKTIASLMTDGCNMGIKSLNQYLNQYQAADGASKGIAQRLCSVEEQLVTDIRPYL